MELPVYRQLSTSAIHSNDKDLWKTLLLRFESVFSRFRSLRLKHRRHDDLSPTDSASLSCDSSVVLRHPNRSRKRRARRCSPTLPRASVGTASGPPTPTTFVARRTRATWRGSNSPMTSRPKAPRNPARECSLSDLRAARDRESRWSWRDRRMAGGCWSAAPDVPSDDQRTLNDFLRGEARAARCAARPLAERPRRANRSWRRDADRRRRRRGRG